MDTSKDISQLDAGLDTGLDTGLDKELDEELDEEPHKLKSFDNLQQGELYVKRDQCFFDPMRSCGSYVRSKLAYDRKTLVYQARQCGIKYTGVSMNSLCALLRNRYFLQQQGMDVVKFFQGDYVLPGYDFTFSSKVYKVEEHPERLFSADVFDLLVPIPEDMRGLSGHAPLYNLSIANTAALISNPSALGNYRSILAMMIKYLGPNFEKVDGLTDGHVYMKCKIIARIIISSYLLSPSEYKIIEGYKWPECTGINIEQLLSYTQNFKRSVYLYIRQNYRVRKLDNFFVEFYRGEISLGFSINNYTELNFIQAMTVFPVTAKMTKQVNLLNPPQPPPYPTSEQVLIIVMENMALVREPILKAMTDTLSWLGLKVEDIVHNIRVLKDQVSVFPRLQLIGRLWATAVWFQFPKIATTCEMILSYDNLKQLHYQYPRTGAYLKEHILSVDYAVQQSISEEIKAKYFIDKDVIKPIDEPFNETQRVPLMSDQEEEDTILENHDGEFEDDLFVGDEFEDGLFQSN